MDVSPLNISSERADTTSLVAPQASQPQPPFRDFFEKEHLLQDKDQAPRTANSDDQPADKPMTLDEEPIGNSMTAENPQDPLAASQLATEEDFSTDLAPESPLVPIKQNTAIVGSSAKSRIGMDDLSSSADTSREIDVARTTPEGAEQNQRLVSLSQNGKSERQLRVSSSGDLGISPNSVTGLASGSLGANEHNSHFMQPAGISPRTSLIQFSDIGSRSDEKPAVPSASAATLMSTKSVQASQLHEESIQFHSATTAKKEHSKPIATSTPITRTKDQIPRGVPTPELQTGPLVSAVDPEKTPFQNRQLYMTTQLTEALVKAKSPIYQPNIAHGETDLSTQNPGLRPSTEPLVKVASQLSLSRHSRAISHLVEAPTNNSSITLAGSVSQQQTKPNVPHSSGQHEIFATPSERPQNPTENSLNLSQNTVLTDVSKPKGTNLHSFAPHENVLAIAKDQSRSSVLTPAGESGANGVEFPLAKVRQNQVSNTPSITQLNTAQTLAEPRDHTVSASKLQIHSLKDSDAAIWGTHINGLMDQRVAQDFKSTPVLSTLTQPAKQVQKIAAQVVSAKNRTTEILLSPQELGTIRLTLQTSEQGVTLVLHAERPETSDIMRRHIDLLAQEFRNLGFSDLNFAFGGQTSSGSGSDKPLPQEATTDDVSTPPETGSVQNLGILTGNNQLDIRL